MRKYMDETINFNLEIYTKLLSLAIAYSPMYKPDGAHFCWNQADIRLQKISQMYYYHDYYVDIHRDIKRR